MSNRKLLKSALANLKVGQPIRLSKKQVELMPPRITTDSLSEANKGVSKPLEKKTHPDGAPMVEKANIEETDSNFHSGKNGLGQNLTDSCSHRGIIEQCQNSSKSKPDSENQPQSQNPTGEPSDRGKSSPTQDLGQSTEDRVKTNQGEVKTPSENDPPPRKTRRVLKDLIQTGALKPKDHFSAVPNSLLRGAGLFENPTDFMIYLSLLSHSYGFGRNTCDMGLTQLINFTSLSRNSVRASLERLRKSKWIREISGFEHGGVSRKWRIYCAWEKGIAEQRTYFTQVELKSGAKNDSVKSKQSAQKTQSGSNSAPVTGSKIDTYKDIYKKNSKKSLSPDSKILREYFENLRPESKRTRERKFFEELKRDFQESEIAEALEFLQSKGEPRSGEKCHSPMAFLVQAMSEVLAEARKNNAARSKRERAERERYESELKERQEAKEAQERWELASSKFEMHFSETEQNQFIEKFSKERFTSFQPPTGVARRMAIQKWYQQTNANQE